MKRAWVVLAMLGCGGPETPPPDAPPALLEAYIKASNSDAGDGFGLTIAMSADGATLAVGAPMEQGGATGINGNDADNSWGMSGAVYIFVKNAGVWSQQAYVKPATREQGWFGSAVTLSADGATLVVGAPMADNLKGAVYVFRRTAGVWTQDARLVAPPAVLGTQFGQTIAMSGDATTLAVGIRTANDTGAVQVFVTDASGWLAQARLGGLNMVNDRFGYSALSMSSSGDVLAVGAPGDSAVAEGSGAAYVFDRVAGTWTQQAYLKAAHADDHDEFGSSLSVAGNGNTIAVGAHAEDSAATGVDGDQTNNSAQGSGAVFVFMRSSAAWTLSAYLKGAQPGGPVKQDAGMVRSSDAFGAAVAFSRNGNVLIISAPGDANGAGALYKFESTASSWLPRNYFHASNAESPDSGGAAVAVTDDGAIIAFTSWQEASDADGIGGSQTDNSAPGAGAAYVFVAP